MATSKNVSTNTIAQTLKQRITHHFHTTFGDLATAKYQDKDAKTTAFWKATSQAIQEIITEKLTHTQAIQANQDVKSVNYLSLEYLMGRLLSNNLHNLDLYQAADQAVTELGYDLTDLCEQGADLALGNGGLGRLAACFLDSLATLNYHATGYGIHYQHGLFKQSFKEGRQVEEPDLWREFGSPWEVCREDATQRIPLFGHVDYITQIDGTVKQQWTPGKMLKGIAWDVPVVGYRSHTINALRLWECRAEHAFNWDHFNNGDYINAHHDQIHAEIVSMMLYPNDEHLPGKELRFIQQYFFCACSIKDIIRRFELQHGELSAENSGTFEKLTAIQLNDTHPTIAILELMRVLLDEKSFTWGLAWNIARSVFAYTNHTLLPEALEKWPVSLFEHVLPRHLTILYRINESFLNDEVSVMWPNDDQMRAKLSMIEEGHERKVRMAHLAVAASHKVNGVAQIHSQLVKSDLFPEFNQLWPEKLTNVTNGITPRRWLKACNPELSALINQHVSQDWAKDLHSLQQLTSLADNEEFQHDFMRVKHNNKVKLTTHIKELTGIDVNPEAIFDIQIKRLHEYKRQHLNLLHILALYRRLLANPELEMHPQVFIFGAKAAPGYKLAKDIIYAINKVSEKINHDTRIQDKLKVVFLPNYRVSLAEKIIPAADVSEQISTAGKEASGTGNMKLALNGAVTIGTLDGANIEIAEEVGSDNIFIFGMTVEQVKTLNTKGYNPYHLYEQHEEIKACLDWLDSDYFTPGEFGALSPVKESLLSGGDPYKVLADFESYSQAQRALNSAYRNKSAWAKMAILNTALMGKFNSDRSIEDYVRNIWHLTPTTGKLD